MGLLTIQNKISVKQTGVFGPETARALMFYFQLNTVEAAHYLGQIAHETRGFRDFEENLNYTAARLAAVWPARFSVNRHEKPLRPNEIALRIAGDPVTIGNTVYGGRMGNVNPGDGYRFRGRGKPHLTGRTNYEDFAKWLNVPEIVTNPDLVATEYAIDSGLYFFERNGLFKLCKDLSEQSILNVSRAINIGRVNTSLMPNGLDDRRNQTLNIFQWLVRKP